MNEIEKNILEKVAGISDTPQGAYNIRFNATSAGRASSENITILPKDGNKGVEIHVKPGTKKETVYIPVVLSQSGLKDMVLNDFFIGENSDVLIIAGCGIHNDGHELAQHDGIHTFFIGKNAHVRYEEKHYGEGAGTGQKILNPVTSVYLEEGSSMEMDTIQIKGVDSTKRITKAVVGDRASIRVTEKLMTHGIQQAVTEFDIELNGAGSGANIISRSVAKGKSVQIFLSKIDGNNRCTGHSECDAIIMDEAVVRAIPEITASSVDASLIHEAAIGKIAGEQIVKLMTLGLTQEEAEAQIVNGFLK